MSDDLHRVNVLPHRSTSNGSLFSVSETVLAQAGVCNMTMCSTIGPLYRDISLTPVLLAVTYFEAVSSYSRFLPLP